MPIQEDVSLQPYNTFGVDVKARYFCNVQTVEELQEILQNSEVENVETFVLGGGSNLLLTKDYEGVVICNEIEGIETIKETADHVWIKAYGGEIWHDLVEYCLAHDLAGIENLSLIPGKVGAAPMQNIGAYGVELKEVFEHLEAVRLSDGQLEVFQNEDCQFGYRDSIFKNDLKGQYCIVSITLRLDKDPRFNVSYGSLRETLEEMGVEQLSIQAISEAVCKIRQSKLPDPQEIGNAGSFFKNPYVSQEKFEQLKKETPDVKGYPVNDEVKVPAGWLIEKCGYKGVRKGNVGTYKNQALIIVNHGGAKPQEILSFAEEIKQEVNRQFGIQLQPEVNIV